MSRVKKPSQRELRRRAVQKGEEPKGRVLERPLQVTMGVHDETGRVVLNYNTKLDHVIMPPSEAMNQAWWLATLARRVDPSLPWPVEGAQPVATPPAAEHADPTGKPN